MKPPGAEDRAASVLKQLAANLIGVKLGCARARSRGEDIFTDHTWQAQVTHNLGLLCLKNGLL